jgi:hypothetical protein
MTQPTRLRKQPQGPLARHQAVNAVAEQAAASHSEKMGNSVGRSGFQLGYSSGYSSGSIHFLNQALT